MNIKCTIRADVTSLPNGPILKFDIEDVQSAMLNLFNEPIKMVLEEPDGTDVDVAVQVSLDSIDTEELD